MAIHHGVGINWGVNSTIVSVNGLFQTREHNFSVKAEEITDAGDTSVSKVYWDFKEFATFTYVSFQPGYWPNGNAPISIPSLSSWIRVYDPTYSIVINSSQFIYKQSLSINGYWLVDDIVTAGSNTTSVRVTLKLSRYPYIQVNPPSPNSLPFN